MLCRTASDLYWVSRLMERAENTARLLDVTQRIAMLPERLDRGKMQAAPWRRALDALGLADDVIARYGVIDADTVTRHLLLSPDNPNSIHSCFRIARENARAQRVAITAEMYEDLNSAWLDMKSVDATRLRREGVSSLLEWVKGRSAAFRGVTLGTLGRGEGYHFLQLGAFVERGDWSIRLLDVVGSDGEIVESGEARDAVDYFQWSALLQSLSAFETYRRLYRQSVNPGAVAELMLLKEENPRSLQSSANVLHDVLQRLSGGASLECVRQAGALSAQVRYARIDEIIGGGLEAWLQDALDRLARLGAEIHTQFMSVADPMPPRQRFTPRAPQRQWQTTASP